MRSDIVVRAQLLHSHKYRIGRRLIGQSRFRLARIFKGDADFWLVAAEEFTVTYYVNPSEIGHRLPESPQPGDYLIFLRLRNVRIHDRIVGYVADFDEPDPFALRDFNDDTAKQVVEALR